MMLNLFDKTRCKRCHNERIVRKCPRFNKDICWTCCNETRYNLSCPNSCEYAGKPDPNSPFPSFKSDSFTEAAAVSSLYLDLWIDKPLDALDNKSPREAAKEDSHAFLKWLSGYQFPPFFPLEHLSNKLDLEVSELDKIAEPEDICRDYLDLLISLDWDAIPPLTINTDPPEGAQSRYTEILSKVKVLSKISTYRVIHGGTTEDSNTALVYYEINHSRDLTLVLSKKDGNWRIRQNILGSPKDYFLQNQVYKQIAEYLSNADDANAWSKIEHSLRIYPDSSDLYYYRGLYWQLVKDFNKAKVDFFNSISLDNALEPSSFHLAILNAQDSMFDEAIYWFSYLNKLKPNQAETLSNLAACYAASGDKVQARAIWQKLRITHPEFEAAKLNLEKLDAQD